MIGVPEARSRFRDEWDVFRGRIEQLLQQQCKAQEDLFAQISQHPHNPALVDAPAIGAAQLYSAATNAGAGLSTASPADGGKKRPRLVTLGCSITDLGRVCEEQVSVCPSQCSSDVASGRLRQLATNIARIDGSSADACEYEHERPHVCAMCRLAVGLNNPDALAKSPRKFVTSVEDSLAALFAAVKEIDVKVSACGAEAGKGGPRRMGSLGTLASEDGALSSFQIIPEGEFESELVGARLSVPPDSHRLPRVASTMEALRMRMNSNRWWRQLLVTPVVAALLWFRHLEQPTPQGRLAAFVRSRHFEAVLFLVIVANACFTWYALDYEAAHLNEDDSPVIRAIEIFFVAFYSAELVLKLCVHRHWFFVNQDMRWNLFDAVLVIMSLVHRILIEFTDGAGAGNVNFVRTLRLLKLATLLRGLRVIGLLEELRTMLFSLLGSVQSLMWGILLLVLVFYVFGLVFVQGAVGVLTDASAGLSDEERENILQVYGSVERAMYTLYRSCSGGDDWSNFFRPASTIGGFYAALFCFFVAFSQIALLNILTAIFLNKAMEIAKPDKESAGIQQRKLELAAYEDICVIGQELDSDNDGFVRVADFDREIRQGSLGARLGLLGLNVTDADFFFKLLLGSGDAAGAERREVSVDAFVEGCMRMRGAASGIDLCSVEAQTRLILRNLRRQSQTLSALTHAVKVLCQTDN